MMMPMAPNEMTDVESATPVRSAAPARGVAPPAAAARRRPTVAILVSTPAPYRAFEFDMLEDGLSDRYDFRTLFLTRVTDLGWKDDCPRRMEWEVLPESILAPLARRYPWPRYYNKHTCKRLSELDADVVWMHGYDAPALWAAWLWCRWRHRPIIFRGDSNVLSEVVRGLDSPRMRVKRLLVREFLRPIRGYLTIGTANERYFQLYGADPATFHRASFMVDVDMFRRRAAEQRQAGCPLKAQMGIKAPRVILYIGRFVPAKGLDTLLAAFEAALPRLGDVALVMVGSGPQLDAYRAKAAHLGDRVVMPGFREAHEVASIFGIGDVFALPSFDEPWGLVVNEAMAAGLPVVASDRVGAAVDLVLPGRTGERFPAGDVPALTAALERVLADESRTREMGEAGRAWLERWNRRYDTVEAVRHCLDSVLAASPWLD